MTIVFGWVAENDFGAGFLRWKFFFCWRQRDGEFYGGKILRAVFAFDAVMFSLTTPADVLIGFFIEEAVPEVGIALLGTGVFVTICAKYFIHCSQRSQITEHEPDVKSARAMLLLV